jgi:prohibitin 2
VKYSRVFGVLEEVYGEGTHFRLPWLEEPVVYDVRAKPRNIPSLTGTKGKSSPNVPQEQKWANIYESECVKICKW